MGKNLCGLCWTSDSPTAFSFQGQRGLWKGWATSSSGYWARSKEGTVENADVDLQMENTGVFCQDTSPGADQHNKVPEGVGWTW